MPAQKKYSKQSEKAVDLDKLGLEFGNKPPQALDVEESVLGAMLLEPNCVDLALEELTPQCFYDPRHRTIFEAMSSLSSEHCPVDIVTVTDRLKSRSQIDEVGGVVTLSRLSEKVGSAANIEFYLKILKQKTIQRDLISAAYNILKNSYDDSVKVDDLVDIAETKVYDAIQSNVRREIQSIGEVVNEALSDIEKRQGESGLSGVPSGFESLDVVTGGWQPSDLIILAARPSVGKTAFALNLARNAAVEHHFPVAFFSLEMSSLQLAKRLMVSESGLSADKIKGGVSLSGEEWEQLEVNLRELVKAPIYIDDTPSLQLMEFRTKAKNLVKNKKVRIIFVDYLQLMQGPSELRGMREQEVAAVSRTLKATAKELNVPIIALSQLSRNAVQRQAGNGKPQLSDLRESGSIEQDADMVIFIHRPDYVGMSENIEDREKTQIIIAKHRNGETKDIDMTFKSNQIRFMELSDAMDVQAMYASAPVASSLNSDDSPVPFDSFIPNNEEFN